MIRRKQIEHKSNKNREKSLIRLDRLEVNLVSESFVETYKANLLKIAPSCRNTIYHNNCLPLNNLTQAKIGMPMSLNRVIFTLLVEKKTMYD